MPKVTFDHALPLALRAIQVRAAAAVATGRTAATDREDLEQEALLGIWVSLKQYDPTRAGVRTFVERVAEKRFASLLRRRQTPPLIESLDGHQFPTADGIPAVQFRLDFERVMMPFADSDRALALLLLDHGPTEISKLLGVARSTVYARVARLRRAFRAAGYGPTLPGGGAR